jgi:hypothetical protein
MTAQAVQIWIGVTADSAKPDRGDCSGIADPDLTFQIVHGRLLTYWTLYSI